MRSKHRQNVKYYFDFFDFYYNFGKKAKWSLQKLRFLGPRKEEQNKHFRSPISFLENYCKMTTCPNILNCCILKYVLFQPFLSVSFLVSWFVRLLVGIAKYDRWLWFFSMYVTLRSHSQSMHFCSIELITILICSVLDLCKIVPEWLGTLPMLFHLKHGLCRLMLKYVRDPAKLDKW